MTVFQDQSWKCRQVSTVISTKTENVSKDTTHIQLFCKELRVPCTRSAAETIFFSHLKVGWEQSREKETFKILKRENFLFYTSNHFYLKKEEKKEGKKYSCFFEKIAISS